MVDESLFRESLLASEVSHSLFPSYCICHSASVSLSGSSSSWSLPVGTSGSCFGSLYLSSYTFSPCHLTKSHSLVTYMSVGPKSISATQIHLLTSDLEAQRHIKLSAMKRRPLDFLPNLLFLHLSERHRYLSSGSRQTFSCFPLNTVSNPETIPIDFIP